jgi:hypothetical protein
MELRLLIASFMCMVALSVAAARINSDILRLPGPPLGEDFTGLASASAVFAYVRTKVC